MIIDKANKNIFMKTVYIFLILVVSVISLKAQTLPANTEFYKKKELNLDLKDYLGSKYLEEDFKISVVKDGLTNKDYDTWVRYDILNEVFEIKENYNHEVFTFLKKTPATSIVLDNRIFIYETYTNNHINQEAGYIEMLGSLSDNIVYVKHYAEVRLPEKAKTTLEKDRKGKISKKLYFLIKKNENIRYFDLDKKSIFTLIPESKKSDVKDFMKKNKNKVRDIQEVSALIDFLEIL